MSGLLERRGRWIVKGLRRLKRVEDTRRKRTVTPPTPPCMLPGLQWEGNMVENALLPLGV